MPPSILRLTSIVFIMMLLGGIASPSYSASRHDAVLETPRLTSPAMNAGQDMTISRIKDTMSCDVMCDHAALCAPVTCDDMPVSGQGADR